MSISMGKRDICFNGKTGHLFDNRYSRVAVESDTQAVQLLDYIHFNPV